MTPPVDTTVTMPQYPQMTRYQAPMSPAALRAYERNQIFSLFGGHALLALVMKFVPFVATLHAFLTLGIGLYLVGSKRPERAVYVLSYIAGAELLWRINHARIFWEFGKYGSIVIGLVLLGRMRFGKGLAGWAYLYMVLLIPGCILALGALGFTNAARREISLNISGPVALALLVVVFSGLDMSKLRFDRLLYFAVAPMIGVSALAVTGIVTAANLRFTGLSSHATSAGYGPNQVSTILGLAALLCLLMALHNTDYQIRLVLFGLSGLLVVQSVLTFSRGGVFNIAISAVAFSLHYLRKQQLNQVLVVLVILLGLGGAVVFPKLNEWTGGSLKDRFSSFDTTGRADIAQADWKIFKENLVLGVGVGQSPKARKKFLQSRRVSAHTEYSRMLSEHGILGVLALLTLGAMMLQAYIAAPHLLGKAWVAGMASWSLAAMTHAGMRIVAISLLFALAMIKWPRGPDRASDG